MGRDHEVVVSLLSFAVSLTIVVVVVMTSPTMSKQGMYALAFLPLRSQSEVTASRVDIRHSFALVLV